MKKMASLEREAGSDQIRRALACHDHCVGASHGLQSELPFVSIPLTGVENELATGCPGSQWPVRTHAKD